MNIEQLLGQASPQAAERAELFRERVGAIKSEVEIRRGLEIVSGIIGVAHDVCREEGLIYISLPPIGSSFGEYGSEYVVTNPLTGEKGALPASPQIDKEVAAISVGSNWRIADCSRLEPGDATHAQHFRQIDVELSPADGKKARDLAGAIFNRAHRIITGSNAVEINEYDFLQTTHLYGEGQPNLNHGPYLRTEDGLSGLVADQNPDCRQILEADERLVRIDGPQNKVYYGLKNGADANALIQLQQIRKEKFGQLSGSGISAYWLTGMPYAYNRGDGTIGLTHHIMSMPLTAVGDDNFDFDQYSDEQLTTLKCDSYDLVVCPPVGEALEIAGGDARIPTASLQLQALERMGIDPIPFLHLLMALQINENTERKTLAGFAFGVERLAMILGGLKSIDQVQLLSMNDPEMRLLHIVFGLEYI